jgi:hypothetical protein
VATRFRMEFSLCRSVDYDMCQQGAQLPTCSGICPVQLDCGYAQVRQDSQNTNLASLAGSKRIRFASSLPYAVNGWAPIALEVMVKETARAACTAPSTCPGAPTPSCAPAMPEQPCDDCPDHCMQKPYVEPDNGASLCP